MNTNRHPAHPRAAGFSLIELLVSMVIGLVVTLAITSVLIRTEGAKRSTTSVNDLNQNGAYIGYAVDRAIRNAGSGFAQRWNPVFGCLLNASMGGTQVLPITAMPASSAFAGWTLPVRMAPVVIGKGLANTTGAGAEVRGDVLMVMSGTAGIGETPQKVTPGSVTTSEFQTANAIGYRQNDMVLLADPGVGGCMVQQVSSVTGSSGAQRVSLAGTYFNATGSSASLSNFGGSSLAVQLGNAVDNPPHFQFFGVGANNTLNAFDLLQPDGSETPVADGVVEMRALYGVDNTTPPDNVLDDWIDPIAASGFEASVLMNGSAASQANLRRIVAIRVGFILRTSLAERDSVAPADLTLFADLGAPRQQQRTLSAAERFYRFRTVEVTIPLRNLLLAPQS